MTMAGNLYIVSTPIGNLDDMTFRSIQILKSADIIACEDTRHTKKILNYYKIKNRLTSYHDHNESLKSAKLLKDLMNGKSVALVADAGTPCISDPGYKVVKMAIENGINVSTIPGVSSVISALTLSGLPADSFSFFGFAPRNKKAVTVLIDDIKFIKSTLIFFESPKRIRKTISYFLDRLGNRNAAVCRELTKLHEEVIRGTLEEINREIETRETVKGEICLVIEGFKEDRKVRISNDIAPLDKRLRLLKNMEISLSDAVKLTCHELNLPKRGVYQKALEIWDS